MKKICCPMWSQSLNANRFPCVCLTEMNTGIASVCVWQLEWEECELVCEKHRGTLCE